MYSIRHLIKEPHLGVPPLNFIMFPYSIRVSNPSLPNQYDFNTSKPLAITITPLSCFFPPGLFNY